MKKLALLLLAASLLPLGGSAFGDTGTYRILSYRVGLTPHSDGTVAIDYYQKWLVTGGGIPWITIGTPNGHYTITGSGGAVSGAEDASGGEWSGVRLDLDRNYRPGETFEASVSIVQRGLFYAEEKKYRLDFTPGWYDRAAIDTLRIGVKFFASMDSVTTDPPPSVVSGDEMAWGDYSLLPGEHFTIHLSFPVGHFPAGIAKGNLKNAPGGAGAFVPIFLIFMAVIVIMALRFSKRRYSGGRIFYGGIPGGRAGGGRSGGGRSGSGGGGFGGASMSCACACVSCACACACAGGGGAGCGRKLEHTCPVCGKKRGS
jgi:hypothetical protein